MRRHRHRWATGWHGHGKVPCSPGAEDIRGRRLHCRHDRDREGWRKAPRQEEPGSSGKESESLRRGVGLRPLGPLAIWGFRTHTPSLLGAAEGQGQPWTLGLDPWDPGPRSQVGVFQPPLGFFGKVLALGLGQWDGSCGCRGLRTAPRRAREENG